MDQHQEAHMPAMGIVQRVVVVHAPMVEAPPVNKAATLEPQTPQQAPK